MIGSIPRRDRARQWAAVALAVLTALQVLAALAFLLVLTTVPPELNLQTGPRSPSVGPSRSEPQQTGLPPTGSAPTGSAPTGSAPAAGDLVDVGRSDGRTATYRVIELVTVDKDRFPTQRVYGPTAGPELHLITCGGSFDRASGHYLRNVVVSAVLVQLR